MSNNPFGIRIEEAISNYFYSGVAFPSVDEVELATPIGKGPIGTPLYDQLSLLPLTYQNANGETISLDAYDFPSVVLVSPSATLVEVLSHDGGLGEHVEIDNWGAWEISIQGMIISPHDKYEYPGEQVSLMNEYVSNRQTYDVSCKYLNRLGIQKIRFKGKSFPEYAGYLPAQPFELQARSVVPKEINLISTKYT